MAKPKHESDDPTARTASERSRLFFNRELSWLNFNHRVLEEALDEDNPLLERVKFLAIASTNFDEFFEVRVAGIMEMVDAGLSKEAPDGLNPSEELDVVREKARVFTIALHRCWKDHLVPALSAAGINFREPRQLPSSQRAWLNDYFQREIYPVLTPLAVDPAHPFPVLLNKSLNLAVLLLDPRQKRKLHRIAVVQVPRVLPRLVKLPDEDGGRTFVFTADLVAEHLDVLFPGLEVLHACSFRITRDSNIDVDEFAASDLLTSIEKELINRRRGEPVRLEIDQGAHPDILDRFTRAFGLESDDVYFCDGPVNLGRIMALYQKLDIPELKDTPFVPRNVMRWTAPDEMFADLRDGDVLVHHPYESFGTVEDFVRLAVRDPQVLAIKQTIYRAGSDSPLVEALIEAAKERKQVTVVVELKARFDEEANIEWARRMGRAGVHVVYGIVGLKTHAKATLVVRREDDGIRRYCHFGTGNYNPTTARLYTDLGLLTARADIGQEIADTFNMITGYSRVPAMDHLLVSPFTMRARITELIAKEAKNARDGKPAGIKAKLNSLADPGVIRALYEASQAGVQIHLGVRGICCLRPGLPGVSDNIIVTSVVDRFLEHSRIFYFENSGDPLVFLASADWMIRNLDRRVETAAPILDSELRRRVVDEVLAIHLADNVKARRILPDGGFERVTAAPGEKRIRSQQVLMERASREAPAARIARDRTKKRKKGKLRKL